MKCFCILSFASYKGVQRGLVGEIVKRFEQKGFKLVAMKFVQVKFVTVNFCHCHMLKVESCSFSCLLFTYLELEVHVLVIHNPLFLYLTLIAYRGNVEEALCWFVCSPILPWTRQVHGFRYVTFLVLNKHFFLFLEGCFPNTHILWNIRSSSCHGLGRFEHG